MDVCAALATPPAHPHQPAPEVAHQPISRSSPSEPAYFYEPRAVSEEYDRGEYDQISYGSGDAEPIGCNSAPFPECLTRPRTPGTDIGHFKDCHLIAEGLASRVYRLLKPNARYALKVTDTHPPAPHNPQRENKILRSLMADINKSHSVIQKIGETFYDSHGRFVMVSPYYPRTLEALLAQGPMQKWDLLQIFPELFSGLAHIHKLGIIHRDVKPSNILLSGHGHKVGHPCLIDFGTAWHPVISLEGSGDNISEPADSKIIEVGTSCYRAPETLFGNKRYDTSLDMWSAGCVLAECLSSSCKTLFTSPPSYEDGNQLGLILSIFKTLGTPTPQTWPGAQHFPTKPFEWYREFPTQSWDEILPERNDHAWGGVLNSNRAVKWEAYQELVRGMCTYESGERMTAQEAVERLGELRKREMQAQQDDDAGTDAYDMF